jgi:ABC-type molybdate transport system substrate-binding protein
LHEPILQQAVALANAEHPAAAAELLEFLKCPDAVLIMIRFGYLVPEN